MKNIKLTIVTLTLLAATAWGRLDVWSTIPGTHGTGRSIGVTNSGTYIAATSVGAVTSNNGGGTTAILATGSINAIASQTPDSAVGITNRKLVELTRTNDSSAFTIDSITLNNLDGGLSPTAALNAVAAISDSLIVAVGDSGAVYQTQYYNSQWSTFTVSYGINNINFRTIAAAGSDTAYMAGDKGAYYSCINSTINPITNSGIPSTFNAKSLAFKGNIGILVGTNTNGPGVYRSTNKGLTWTAITSIFPANAVAFLSIDTIYIVRGFGIYESTDTGKTWLNTNNFGAGQVFITADSLVSIGISGGVGYAIETNGTIVGAGLTSQVIGTPSITAPTGNLVDLSSPITLSWNPAIVNQFYHYSYDSSSVANGYEVHLASGASTFDTTIYSWGISSTQSVKHTLNYGTTYTFQIRAFEVVDSGNDSTIEAYGSYASTTFTSAPAAITSQIKDGINVTHSLNSITADLPNRTHLEVQSVRMDGTTSDKVDAMEGPGRIQIQSQPGTYQIIKADGVRI